MVLNKLEKVSLANESSKTEDESAEQFLLINEIGEFNDMRTDDRIKEFENE